MRVTKQIRLSGGRCSSPHLLLPLTHFIIITTAATLTLFHSTYFFSNFLRNDVGVRAYEKAITTTIHMKNVKSNFSWEAGIELKLSGDSKVVLNNVKQATPTTFGLLAFY